MYISIQYIFHLTLVSISSSLILFVLNRGLGVFYLESVKCDGKLFFDGPSIILPLKITIVGRRVTHSFAPKPLIFKSQWMRSLKIQWYLYKLELPKNWPGDRRFKLRKLKFWVSASLFFNSNFLVNSWDYTWSTSRANIRATLI